VDRSSHPGRVFLPARRIWGARKPEVIQTARVVTIGEILLCYQGVNGKGLSVTIAPNSTFRLAWVIGIFEGARSSRVKSVPKCVF
jgi:hypothetical protein